MPIDTTGAHTSRGTILVAEDDDATRQLLCQVLHRAHFTVRAYANGQLAYDALKDYKPDVILLDWVMPVMDGQRLVELLKADVERRSIPIIMLTTHSEIEERVAALDRGVQDYLIKPCDPRELVARLDQQVRWRRTLAVDANTDFAAERLALYRGAGAFGRKAGSGDFFDRIWGKHQKV
jgi:DNA-binding response OmpR family regulator